MNRHRFAGVVVLALGLILGMARGTTAGQDKPREPREGDLTGKVIAVTTKNPDKAGGVLEKVQIRRLGERLFLVGRPVDDGRADNPYKGVRVNVWIPLDEVIQLLEFDSLAEARKVYEAAGK